MSVFIMNIMNAHVPVNSSLLKFGERFMNSMNATVALVQSITKYMHFVISISILVTK